MAKSKKKKKKANPNTQNQQKKKGINSGYRLGALILCAVIVVSLVAMYAFI